MEMHHRSKYLARTKNGSLVFCRDCGMYQLTFGQFHLELDRSELQHFGAFLEELDPDYWEGNFCDMGLRRRIPIPTQQDNLCLVLDRPELEELKGLVFYRKGQGSISLIKVRDVDYDFIMN